MHSNQSSITTAQSSAAGQSPATTTQSPNITEATPVSGELSIFYKAMMTGLFVGIIDTLICLSYNIGYRDVTGFLPSGFINVSSLIFIVNIVLLLIGLLYFAFIKAFGNKDFVFILVILGLTAWCVWATQTGHRFDDDRLNAGFHGLLSGIILICGLSSAIIPFLYHSKGFEKHVL